MMQCQLSVSCSLSLLEVAASQSQLANMTFSSSRGVVCTTQKGKGFHLMADEPKLIKIDKLQVHVPVRPSTLPIVAV